MHYFDENMFIQYTSEPWKSFAAFLFRPRPCSLSTPLSGSTCLFL